MSRSSSPGQTEVVAAPGSPPRRLLPRVTFVAWWVVSRLVGLLDRLVPAGRDHVVMHSYPDLDDNVVALLRSPLRARRVTVLANDATGVERRLSSLTIDPRPKVVAKSSARGAWAFARSACAYSTHGLFLPRSRPGSKRHVGLWHGEFGKAIGAFDGERMHPYDWMPVSGSMSRDRRVAEFSLPETRIRVVGLPRQQVLVSDVEPLPGWNVVFVPTYRRSAAAPDRLDGDSGVTTGTLIGTLDRWLEDSGATLWWRPHPLEASEQVMPSRHCRPATNEALEALGLSFYELLARSQCLVTDYSSVWVDYLLLDQPIVGYCPDLESYRRRRGLALEPHEEWFPGPIAQDPAELVDLLDRAKARPGQHKELRALRRRQLHEWTGNPSDAAWRARLATRGC